MDARLPSTHTIWLITAGLLGLGVLISLFSGSVIVAILLVLLTAGCVVASRRAPKDDGRAATDAESTDGDEEADPEEDDPEDDERAGDS
jgi:hypothetical protein